MPCQLCGKEIKEGDWIIPIHNNKMFMREESGIHLDCLKER